MDEKKAFFSKLTAKRSEESVKPKLFSLTENMKPILEKPCRDVVSPARQHVKNNMKLNFEKGTTSRVEVGDIGMVTHHMLSQDSGGSVASKSENVAQAFSKNTFSIERFLTEPAAGSKLETLIPIEGKKRPASAFSSLAGLPPEPGRKREDKEKTASDAAEDKDKAVRKVSEDKEKTAREVFEAKEKVARELARLSSGLPLDVLPKRRTRLTETEKALNEAETEIDWTGWLEGFMMY